MWSKSFGAAGRQNMPDQLACDGSGNCVIVLGQGRGVDIGAGPSTGGVVAKLDQAGNVVWSRNWTGASCLAVATDTDGTVAVVGALSARVDFDGVSLGPLDEGSFNAYVAKLDAAGACLWVRRFGASAPNVNSLATTVSFDPSGAVVVGGRFGVRIDLGAGDLTAPNLSGQDGFLLKLSPDGDHVWSRSFGSASAAVESVAVGALGDVVCTGWFAEHLDIGGAAVATADGEFRMYVAGFGPQGDATFLKTYGSWDVPVFSCRAALEPSGRIALTGSFTGSVDFGGGVMTAPDSGAAYVAHLSPSGEHIWSKSFGNGLTQAGASVSVDAAGKVYATGGFAGTVDFGAGSLTCVGEENVFLLEFGPFGNLLGARQFGAAGRQMGLAVAVGAGGEPVIAGSFTGSIDFGGGPIQAVGEADIFIASISASN